MSERPHQEGNAIKACLIRNTINKIETGSRSTCSHARSQSLEACSNDMGSTEWIKKARQTSNEMYGRQKETSRKLMDQNREEQSRLKEIH